MIRDDYCGIGWAEALHMLGLAEVGFDLIDSLLYPSYRAQPAGRRQLHARRNYSTLLVFRKAA